MIDLSSFDPNLQVAMLTVGAIRNIALEVANKTNGAVSPYKFVVTPNTPVDSGDELTFQMPV